MPRPEGVRAWHVITGEYPPQTGGVADYTAAVAAALAEEGASVHVWTSGGAGCEPGPVTVHRVLGSFRRRELAAAASLIQTVQGRDRILVQWVPHAFGRGGVNVAFALWLRAFGARHLAPVDVMVHEPFVPFGGSAAQHGAAIAQRVMTAAVLRGASRAFAGTPAWIEMCRPFAGGVPFRWSPVPSGVPAAATAAEVESFRLSHGIAAGQRVIGVFGRAGRFQQLALAALATRILEAGRKDTKLLLIGLGSDRMRDRLLAADAAFAAVAGATGTLAGASLSAAIGACDVMFQPLADGICTRHSSVAALLAHGRAIVANSGRFTEEIWRRSAAVDLVAGADPDALAAATMRLAGDAPARQRLAGAARRLYDEHFHVRHTVAALQEGTCG